jgi:hypothetical protein
MSEPHTAESSGKHHVDSGIHARIPREPLPPASGGVLRVVIDPLKLDSFVQVAITKRS